MSKYATSPEKSYVYATAAPDTNWVCRLTYGVKPDVADAADATDATIATISPPMPHKPHSPPMPPDVK